MKKNFFIIAFLFLLLPISSATANSIAFNKSSEQEMLANFVKTGDPAFDLYNFAKDNNLNLKKAKKILKRNLGCPKISKEEYFSSIARTKNPEEDLKVFALSKNITFDEAKIFLTQLFGEPEML